MMMVTALVLMLLIKFSTPISELLQITAHPEYITLMAWVVGLDALATIPFSRLRMQGKPKKFAFIKIGGIVLNILATYYFISILPEYIATHPGSVISSWFKPDWAVGYVLLAGIVQNVFVLLLLNKEIGALRFSFDFDLWKQMMLYALPLILVGFGGMINETFDRIMLGWWAPGGSPDANKAIVGIYSACYKLSILITILILIQEVFKLSFFENKWYLFYHDSSLSKGVTHLRSVKVTELVHDENGFIKTIKPYND